MEAGLLGQTGDNARDPAERDYRRENGPVRTRILGMEERNAWAHLNSTGIVSLVGAGMEVGLLGQAGDNVRDLAGRDYRPENGPVQTRLLDMEERNVWARPNSIRIASSNDAQ